MSSLWFDPAPAIPTDKFEPHGHYDAIVAGAGLTGLVSALLLSRAGLRVAVVESRVVGAGTTGHTTAKVSLLQGSTVSSVRESNSTEVTQAYVEGNREGQAWLRRYLDEANVTYQVKDAYTYAVQSANQHTLEAEASASAEAGLSLEMQGNDQVNLPFPIAAALVLPNQFQVNPLDVLAELARDFRERGGKIFEDTRVLSVDNDSAVKVRTSQGDLSSDSLILATGIPILDRGGYFARLEPDRSYVAVYARTPGTSTFPAGMYLSVDSPSHSIRTVPDNDTDLLMVGGNGHHVGKGNPLEARATLEQWAQDTFNVTAASYRWSAQDYRAVHNLPLVGVVRWGKGRIFAATGYNKWGLTNAVAASLRLAANILGGEISWGATLDNAPNGLSHVAETAKLNLGVAKDLTAGWAGALTTTETGLPRPQHDDDAPTKAPIPRGHVVRGKGAPVAVSTVNGVTRRVSAICPHLGGILSWNDAELSWDCPLHGSRFTASGCSIEGPATSDLKQAEE